MKEFDPYGGQRAAASGWTDPLVALLDPYFLGELSDGRRSFAGVPGGVAERIDAVLVDADVPGDDKHLGPGHVAALVQLLGPLAEFSGDAYAATRDDERVEFTAARLDTTQIPADELAALLEHLHAHGYVTGGPSDEPAGQLTVWLRTV